MRKSFFLMISFLVFWRLTETIPVEAATPTPLPPFLPGIHLALPSPTPSPTLTPTPGLKFYVPPLKLNLFITPSPVASLVPTSSPSLSATTTGSPLPPPPASLFPSPIGSALPLLTSTPVSRVGKMASFGVKEMGAVGLVVFLMIIILLQAQWSKIKDWLNKKTAR